VPPNTLGFSFSPECGPGWLLSVTCNARRGRTRLHCVEMLG